MTTRLKRPPFWRHLALSVAMLGFLAYLGYSALTGQFGIESRRQLLDDLAELQAESAALAVEVDATRLRIALLDRRRLDPDILDERARDLLAMAHPDDLLIMVDEATGKPITSLDHELARDQLNELLAVIPAL